MERTWKYGETILFRAEKLYTAQNYKSFIATFRNNFPDYIYYCYLRHKELLTAPLTFIERVFVPKDCLATLAKLNHHDTLQKMALNLIRMLSDESDVDMADFGIHGSIALNMHAPVSDIDFVVYGSENFRKVEATISQLVSNGQLNYIISNRLDAARKFKGRYLKKTFMFNAIRKQEKVKTKYASHRFSSLAQLHFRCTITDDSETMFRPATYRIANYKPLEATSELPIGKIPDRVVSNIGCYRNVARKGSEIKVAGTLERVESIKTGEVSYQVVVGTATSEEEYIWPV